MRRAFAVFAQAGDLTPTCTICGEPCRFKLPSLVCPNGHTFDVNHRGYVDMRRHPAPARHYTTGFFEARLLANSVGIYRRLIDELRATARSLRGSRWRGGPLVDVGCGDGTISRAVGARCGIDISLPAIEAAARSTAAGARHLPIDRTPLWICADGAHLPLRDGCAGMVLNVFAPADYHEFSRICVDGLLIKVLPGPFHMRELRSALNLPPASGDPQARELAEERTRVLSSTRVTQTTSLATIAEREAIARMSPVSFGRLGQDPELWNTSLHRRIEEMDTITTDCLVLVCELK